MPDGYAASRSVASEPRRNKRVVAWVVAAAALLVIGIVIGGHLRSTREAPGAIRPAPPPRTSRAPARALPTPASAVAAAAQSITAFDGQVLLEPARLRAIVKRIAAAPSRAALTEAFDDASVQTRAKLRADAIPKPAIEIRSIPVGYRLERFSARAAIVAVWYVGIVGSDAAVQPQQSWRTQIVHLVWERGAWKVSSFESSPGPTPPLSTAELVESPDELFAAIPRFEAFERAAP